MLTSGLFRKRRRAFTGSLLVCVSLTVMSMWYLSPMDTELFQSSIHRFRLFGGVNEELPSNFFTQLADDPTLVDIVRNKFIRMPESIGYNLSRPDEKDFSRGLSKVIDNAIIGQKEKGFYVECGAFDGETDSLTLFFERERQWQGLLVEPNRKNYKKLAQKHRNAYSINACIRTDYAHYKTPEKSSEKDAYFAGSSSDVGQHPVPCFWLTTLLLAVGRNAVDLLAVDIHGKEQDLIQTIDFQKVNVHSISVEIPLSYSDTTVKELITLMDDKGYTAAHLFADQVYRTKSLVFKKDAS